jgi:hypothetical protein
VGEAARGCADLPLPAGPPFPERVATGEFYWLAISPVRPPSANILVFARWLRAELAADCVV